MRIHHMRERTIKANKKRVTKREAEIRADGLIMCVSIVLVFPFNLTFNLM